MNILFVIGKYPNYGGTEKMTTVLANNFVDRGYGVSIASFEQPIPDLAKELKSSIRLYDLTYPVLSRNNINCLKDIVSSKRIDIIINQWCLPFHVTLMINIARSKSKTKLLSVLHGVPNRSKRVIRLEDRIKREKGLKSVLYSGYKVLTETAVKLSLRYVYRKSDKYVVLSPCFINAFCKFTHQSRTDKLMAIGNPITVPSDFSLDTLSRKNKVLLYVGRMDMENKRVNRIIEAWEECADIFKDWNLILVGDGPHRKDLESYVSQNKIRGVIFTGFTKEDPIEYYKVADILLLTSDLEGFGLVIVEGMSFGAVPIVYGSYEAVYDIIRNGESGIITPFPYDKNDMVNAITMLINRRDIRIKMAKNAIEDSKRYKIDGIIDSWERLFHQVLA